MANIFTFESIWNRSDTTIFELGLEKAKKVLLRSILGFTLGLMFAALLTYGRMTHNYYLNAYVTGYQAWSQRHGIINWGGLRPDIILVIMAFIGAVTMPKLKKLIPGFSIGFSVGNHLFSWLAARCS